MQSFLRIMVLLLCSCLATGCSQSVRETIEPTDVTLIRYHYDVNMRSLEEFTKRLYAKNPRYEIGHAARSRKINQLFHRGSSSEHTYIYMPSHEVLIAAFDEKTEGDRVYLLCLGLVKSMWETYGVTQESSFFTGLQVPLERLQRLERNISHVNWKLKTIRDRKGDLLFLTNEAGENGYLNMGYEVIMTEILTRIRDDIYLRGGLPNKYLFNVSSLFVSIIL